MCHTRELIGEHLVAEKKAMKLALAKSNHEYRKRLTQRGEEWDEKRPVVDSMVISCTAFLESKCMDCSSKTEACVKCETCSLMLCWNCDTVLHSKQVLHDRKICLGGERIVCMSQNEFLNSKGEKYQKGIWCCTPFCCVYIQSNDAIFYSNLNRCVSSMSYAGTVPILWKS